MKSLLLRVVLVMAAAGPAAAGGRERVAVASFKTLGGALEDPARQQQVRASLAGGLAASDFEVVPAAEVQRALASTPELAYCETAACMRRVGELVKARWVVRASLESVGANWLIQIELIDAQDSTTAARCDETCDVCNVAEANEKLSNAAATLREKMQQHAKPGRPEPPPPPPPHGETRLWRVLGITGVSVGAVGLIAGIVLIAIDHVEVGRKFDTPNMHLIIQRYQTLAPGIAFTVLGAVVGAAGGVALWHDRKLQRQVTVTPAAGPGGAALYVEGRF